MNKSSKFITLDLKLYSTNTDYARVTLNFIDCNNTGFG